CSINFHVYLYPMIFHHHSWNSDDCSFQIDFYQGITTKRNQQIINDYLKALSSVQCRIKYNAKYLWPYD
ncbi:unnamed protein product, partial [Rotaria sp. Silwood1]